MTHWTPLKTFYIQTRNPIPQKRNPWEVEAVKVQVESSGALVITRGGERKTIVAPGEWIFCEEKE